MSTRGAKATRGKGGNPKRSLDNSKSEDILEEEEEDVVPAKKANKAGAGGRKKEPVKKVEEEEEDDLGDEEEDEEDEEDDEDEEDGSEASEDSNPDEPPREYGPRSFVVLKTEFEKDGTDPPLWRIDGNSLLQKFTPFKGKDGNTLYKSTSVYSGWSISSKPSYYAAPVTFQKQDKNDCVVKFERDQVKKEESADDGK